MRVSGLPRRGVRRMFSRTKNYLSLISASLEHEKKHPDKQLENEELEFLPAAVEILETPPSQFARITAFIISLVLLVVITLSWFGYIDTEAVAQGKTVPVGQLKLIQSLIMGKIDRIYVLEGEKVVQGQLLVKLDPTESEIDVKQVSAELLEAQVSVARIQILLKSISDPLKTESFPVLSIETMNEFTGVLSGVPGKRQLVSQQRLLEYDYKNFISADAAMEQSEWQKKASITACEAEIQRLEVLAPLYEDNEKDVHALFKKGHVSRLEWLAVREKQVETTQRLLVEKSRLEEGKAALSSVTSDRIRYQQEFRQQRMENLNEYRQKWDNAELTLEKALQWDQRSYLRASVDGIIEQVNIHTIGGVVEPAQVLMSIVPSNAEIEIEAFVENKDIGFVKEGQIVDIKFESYPYTYYGSLDGSIRYVSSNSIEQPNGEHVYPIRVVMNDQKMTIDGDDKAIQVGMSLTAEVKTGKRRLLEYFMSPLLRYQDEGLKER